MPPSRVWRSSRVPRYHVFGNHDTDQMNKLDYMKRITNTGIAAGATYYSFNQGGVHFIVLDAGFKTDEATAIRAYRTNPVRATTGPTPTFPPKKSIGSRPTCQPTSCRSSCSAISSSPWPRRVDQLFDPAVIRRRQVRFNAQGRSGTTTRWGRYDGDINQVDGMDHRATGPTLPATTATSCRWPDVNDGKKCSSGHRRRWRHEKTCDQRTTP